MSYRVLASAVVGALVLLGGPAHAQGPAMPPTSSPEYAELLKTALLDIRSVFEPSDSYKTAGWTTDNPCSWHGIYCQNGLMALNLEGGGLSAPLDAVVEAFERWPDVMSTLMYVYLDGCISGGHLPANLSAVLPVLTTLSCFGCGLTGPIPSEWTGNAFPSMGWLGLYGNQLTGTIPADIGMPRLINFQMYSNQFTGTLPPNLLNQWPAVGGAWSGIKVVQLDNNLLTGELPASWASSTMEQITLSNNQLSGPVPASWNGSAHSNMPKLTNLRLNGNDKLCGKFPAVAGGGSHGTCPSPAAAPSPGHITPLAPEPAPYGSGDCLLTPATAPGSYLLNCTGHTNVTTVNAKVAAEAVTAGG